MRRKCWRKEEGISEEGARCAQLSRRGTCFGTNRTLSQRELFNRQLKKKKKRRKKSQEARTLESVNGPLLKLLESYLCSWRDLVEVQSVRVVLLLVRRRCELLLPVVDDIPSFWVNPVDILSNHLEL